MSATQHGSLRISSGLGMRVLLVVLIAVCGVGAFLWGRGTPPTASPEEVRSTAMIGIVGPSSAGPDLGMISREVLSGPQLRQILEAVDGSLSLTDSVFEQWGKSIQIEPAPGPAESQQIRIVCTDADRARGARAANEVARRWVTAYRTLVQTEVEQQRADAKKAFDQAQGQYQAAKAALDGYLERHFHDHEQLASRLRAAPAAPARAQAPAVEMPNDPTAPSAARPGSQASVESERAGMQRELAQLQANLRQMLLVRTIAHPEVQDLESRINALNRKLNQLPQAGQAQPLQAAEAPTVAKKLPAIEAGPGLAPRREDEMPSAESHAEAARTFWNLMAAAQRAGEQQQRLVAAEQNAEQDRFRLIQLNLAPVPVATSPASAGRPLWAVLAAVLAFMAGLTMIAGGFSWDGVIRTPSDAESATRVPVLGVLRVADLPDEPETARGPSKGRSLTWIAAGFFLVLSGLAIAI